MPQDKLLDLTRVIALTNGLEGTFSGLMKRELPVSDAERSRLFVAMSELRDELDSVLPPKDTSKMVCIEVTKRGLGGAPLSSGPYASTDEAANLLKTRGWMYSGTYWVPVSGMNPYGLNARIVPLDELIDRPDTLLDPADFVRRLK